MQHVNYDRYILITRRQRPFYRMFYNNKMVNVESSYDLIYPMIDVFADLLLSVGMMMLNLFHFDLMFVIDDYCDRYLVFGYHLFSIY